MKKGVEEVLGNPYVQMGVGMTSLIEYMFQPLTLVLVFFTFEGLIRGIAAFINGEVIPTTPLLGLAWFHGLGERRAREAALGPLVEDKVTPMETPAGGLRIESCRPKLWSELTTISYDDRLFEIDTIGEQGLPRRFVYVLRPAAPHKLVRGLHHYRVDEVFDKEETYVREPGRI